MTKVQQQARVDSEPEAKARWSSRRRAATSKGPENSTSKKAERFSEIGVVVDVPQ